ncbi:MAG: hypothetical protein K8H90_05260 [Thermoanaerobaculia bacterium]|nr:hypothetical protein [Thermoanaerobaculia bacterium]
MRRLEALRTLLGVVAALGLATAAPAQNLLTSNPDFDAGLGLSDWAISTGAWATGPDSGSCALSDSAAGTSGLSGGGSQALAINSDQCVPIDPAVTPTLYLGALFSTPAHVYARLYLTQYSDGACQTHSGFSATLFAEGPSGWSRLLDAVAIPGNVHSVRLSSDFNAVEAGEPQYTGSFDRFYLGAAALLFADDFETESGSACHWSAIVGAS